MIKGSLRMAAACLVIAAVLSFAASMALAAPIINEVMPQNPEWVEIFNQNNDTLNLSEWKISDGASTDDLTCAGISGCSLVTSAEYFLILGNSTSIGSVTSNPVTYFYVDDSLIGNGLSNSGDDVNFSSAVAGQSSSFSYSSSDAVKTWGRQDNGTWTLCTATPGSKNVCTTVTQQVSIFFPPDVFNNGSVFKVNISLTGYSGIFDVKAEIKNSTSNLGEIFNTGANDWQSSFNYIENAINTASATDYSFMMRIDKEYTGTATLQVKLRDASDHTTIVFTSPTSNMNVIAGISGQGDTASHLELIDSPADAEFAETIQVKISAYRGDTSDNTITAFVFDPEEDQQVSDESTVELDNKFTDYSLTIPISIDSNCNDRYDEKNYTVVITGLGQRVEEEINLAGNTESCSSSSSSSKTTYVVDYPTDVVIGQPFTVSVIVDSREDKRMRFSAWNYVYIANKCYSCGSSREENIQYADVAKRERKTIVLQDSMIEGSAGDYQLKVRVLKEGLSTPKEFTYTIHATGGTVKPAVNASSAEESLLNDSGLNDSVLLDGSITGNVVSDLRTEQIKNRGLWILIVILLGIITYLIMTRNG